MKNMKACHVLDDVPDQLYHLGRDPQETTNLAHLHPHLVAELLAEAEAVVAAAPPEVRSGGQKIFYKHTKNISGCG